MHYSPDLARSRRQQAFPMSWLLLAAWLSVVLLFATQWYAYDSTRRTASPYADYLGWSCFIWAQAPLVLWFVWHHPIELRNSGRLLALHAIASVILAFLQVLVEASFGWLRHTHGFSFHAALSHYFAQHIQLYLITYWALLAVTQVYRMHEQARKRQLRAAQLEMQLSMAR